MSLQELVNGHLLKRFIHSTLHPLIIPVQLTGVRGIAGTEAICLQAAVDAGGALHEIDDLVEGDVLRPAAESEAAAHTPQSGQDARLLQRRCQCGHHRLGGCPSGC